MSPSLKEQTPGLDPKERIRNLAMRPVTYARERPAVVFGILGGIFAIGVSTWLILRSQRRTRWQMMKDYGYGAYDWARSKF